MKKRIIVFTNSSVENLVKKNYTFSLRIKSNFDCDKFREKYDIEYVKMTNISWRVVSSGDIFLFYRAQFFLRSISLLVNVLKRLNKVVVFDLDDFYFNLPAYSLSCHLNSFDRLSILKSNIRKSNLVTVSTDFLREQMLCYNANISVCKNTIHTDYFRTTIPETDIIRILITSSDNLKLHNFKDGFLESIRIIKNNFGDKVRFCFLGKFSNIENLNFFADEICEKIPPHEYLSFLKNNNFHIGLVPLGAEEDPETVIPHSSKSNIKFLEFATNGIAGIFSETEPYRKIINYHDGILVKNTTAAWVEAITELITDPELRNKIIINSQETVKAYFSKSVSQDKWLEILNALSIEKIEISHPTRKRLTAFFLLGFVIFIYHINLLHNKYLFLKILFKQKDYREIRKRFSRILNKICFQK
jgi:glycosyltransferase involved in cell wall biosynthesis